MSKSSWSKPQPNIIIEIQARPPLKVGYWLARLLIIIAARLVKSEVTTRRTLPVLEAE